MVQVWFRWTIMSLLPCFSVLLVTADGQQASRKTLLTGSLSESESWQTGCRLVDMPGQVCQEWRRGARDLAPRTSKYLGRVYFTRYTLCRNKVWWSVSSSQPLSHNFSKKHLDVSYPSESCIIVISATLLYSNSHCYNRLRLCLVCERILIVGFHLFCTCMILSDISLLPSVQKLTAFPAHQMQAHSK